MRVRCRFTQVSQIENLSIRSHVQRAVRMEETGLETNREYMVEGVIFRDGVPWYYLCEDLNSEYPVPQCSVFFDLVDSSVPHGWKLVLNSTVELLPCEWADSPNLYERLIDGDPEAIALFGAIRQKHEASCE